MADNSDDKSLAGSLTSLAGQLQAAKDVGAAANSLVLATGGHPVDVSVKLLSLPVYLFSAILS